MKFTSASLVAPLAFAASAAAKEDVLYSKRLTKRGLNLDHGYGYGTLTNISFFHVNDVHARLDEFSASGTNCTNPSRGCFGGYARIKTVVESQRPHHKNSLWLNAGDEFQGTLYYTYYGGEKIAETLNQLNFDAMTLGNHEFDGGDAELGAFLDNITFPVISANVFSENPSVKKKLEKYHIYPEHGLAIIGVTTETTPGIANSDPSTNFTNAIAAVQNAIDEIKATTNITRIAALTHLGYEADQQLARETTGLSLIMGGHSHTPLGNMTNAEGTYPTIVQNSLGHDVFVVTAYRWGEYIGHISVTYDSAGLPLAYHGAPIHITNATAQDPGLQRQIKAWALPFEAFAAEVLGESTVELDQTLCRTQECVLGNYMTDAMLDYRPTASFALINAGGIRASIDAGPITRGEVLTSFPFGNAIVELSLTGEEIWTALEGILTGTNPANNQRVTSFMQLSRNISITYNPSAADFSKLSTVEVAGAPIDNATTYTVVTLDFIAGGGDNIFVPVEEVVALDTQDEVLVKYIRKTSPVVAGIEGRIVVEGGDDVQEKRGLERAASALEWGVKKERKEKKKKEWTIRQRRD